MKASTVYLRAAELLEDESPLNGAYGVGGYSCVAIMCAQYLGRGKYGSGNEHDQYQQLFIPDGGGIPWGDKWGGNAPQCRVLALLFMAAIAADEECK